MCYVRIDLWLEERGYREYFDYWYFLMMKWVFRGGSDYLVEVGYKFLFSFFKSIWYNYVNLCENCIKNFIMRICICF